MSRMRRSVVATAEATWRPMLVDAIGKQMAAHGGIGLAVPVFNAMLQRTGADKMIKDLITAGTRLAETLEAENAALAVLDLPRAAGMLADKRQCRRRVRRRADRARAARAPPNAWRGGCRRWPMENKRLLERAIAAQGRVIGVVARAATAATEPAGYGAGACGAGRHRWRSSRGPERYRATTRP